MLQSERMGREPVLKLIVAFALPSIAGMLAGSLYNIVDRMFVGRVVGPEGLAAISVCFPFMLLLISLCFLFGIGALPLISRALDERNPERAELVLGNVVSSILILSVVLMAFGMLETDSLLRLSGADEKLLPMAREYMRIIRAGFRQNRDVHLGKRGHQARYLRDVIGDMPNIDWFRSAYPAEEWRALVKEARKAALERAAEQYRRRSDYRGAREEMERMLSAREAGSAFYGGADEGITELRRVHNVLLAAMRKLSVTLEAAAFVWMVKSDEGVGDECGA